MDLRHRIGTVYPSKQEFTHCYWSFMQTATITDHKFLFSRIHGLDPNLCIPPTSMTWSIHVQKMKVENVMQFESTYCKITAKF